MNRPILVAVAVLAVHVVRAEMMNARIRFEPSETVSQAGRSLCLKTEVVQMRPDILVIEPNEFDVFQPANPKGRIVQAEGSLSCAALTHMKELGWRFEISDPGDYVVWMRGWFPLAAGYNHGETLDGGEIRNVVDSVDGCKIDKFAPLPGESAMNGKWLVPKMWHWYSNFTYSLAKGSHFLHFPPNGAWCGGCLLDRIVMVKKGSVVKVSEVDLLGRCVRRPASGVVVSRRIKTERIARWMLEAEFENGDGELSFECSYGGRLWTAFRPGEVMTVEGGEDYLFIRIRFSSVSSGRPPVVYGYRFRVEKKEMKK